MADYGFEKNGVQFGFENEDLYNYEAFKYGNVDGADLRKEYSRLRRVANSRLKRMEGTKYDKSQTYLRNVGKYVTLEEIEAEALRYARNLKPEAQSRYVDMHVAKKMSDMYRFLTSKTGSIRGMQRAENNMIEALHERGLTFVNKQNIQQFGEYMEYMRTLHKNRQYDSERAAELFGTASKKGINPMEIAEDFDFWKQHDEELAALPKIANKEKRNAAAYKKLLSPAVEKAIEKKAAKMVIKKMT